MTNNCKISVIVPVYNMYQTIGATLNSIFDQNYPNLELIVVDGGSNDGTYEYLNSKKENIDIYQYLMMKEINVLLQLKEL